MIRKLSQNSSLENLKREAKRWLKALRDGDTAARARLEQAVANPPSEPTLRDVQHALARAYGFDGWDALRSAVGEIERPLSNPALISLLQAAVRADAAHVAQILDDNPALVSQRGTLRGHTGHRTALHFAVGSGPANEETVRTLLARGADPNVRDEGDNAYPLHFAAELLAMPIIRLLVEHGGDVIGDDDMHALNVIGWAACFDPVVIDVQGGSRDERRREVVDYLLAHGATHTIFSAVAMGDGDDVRRIASADRATLDRQMDRANHRRRPLHLAIVKRQLDSLNVLLDLGANTELTDDAWLTPLDQAALNRQEQFVYSLIASGAQLRLPAAIALERDVEQLLRASAGELAPGKRWGALIVSAAERSPGRVIEQLIAHGASPNTQAEADTAVDGVFGYTALHAAAFHGNAEAVAVLLAHGASATIRDSRYHATPAGWADYAQHPDVRDMILAGPIDMFDAVAHNRVDRMREIFDRDPTLLNRPIRDSLASEPSPDDWMKPWWTPLAMAFVLARVDAARELIDLGARTDITTPDGRTLRDLATRWVETVGETEEDGSHSETFSSENGNPDLIVLLEQGATPASQRMSTSLDREGLAARFLANACPDHHIRGGAAHEVARHVAAQLLVQHPDLARENIYTAIVCGDRDYVAHLLAENPTLAREKGGPKGSAGGQSQRFVVSETSASHPRWEPLLYLCYTRLDDPAAKDNALEIARMLLDHGADPNAYFMAGDSRYTPLSGVIGEGEENHLPHPHRDELARLLLDHGANPYDIQLYYNIHFNGRLLWFLEMIYEETMKCGRKTDWANPAWPMLDMGGYGSGARFTLEIALRNNDVELVEWSLSHGADPNAKPAAANHFPKTSLYEVAERRGLDDIAALLLKYGAEQRRIELDSVERFNRACLRRDRTTAAKLIAEHPRFSNRTSHCTPQLNVTIVRPPPSFSSSASHPTSPTRRTGISSRSMSPHFATRSPSAAFSSSAAPTSIAAKTCMAQHHSASRSTAISSA